MNDPTPMRFVLLGGMGLLLMTQLWWLSLPQPEREVRVLRIAREELAMTAPPQTITGQYDWLIQHRLRKLQGMLVVIGAGVLIGGVEGSLRRRKDPYGGYLLSLWTVGLITIGVLPLGALHYITIPVPVSCLPVLIGFTGLGTIGAYGICAGRPAIS